MDGSGPSGSDDTRKTDDNDSMNVTEHENTDFETDSDSTDHSSAHDLEDLNDVEEYPPLLREKMEVEGGQLGFEPEEISKLPQLQENGSSSQNNEGAGRSPQYSPRQSPDHQHCHSDCGSNSNAHIQRASDLLMAVSVSAEVNKMKITEVAVSAMEELAKKALAGAPLWQLQEDGRTEVLNDLEYMREFGHVDATLMDIMKMVEVGEPQRLPISLDTSTNSGSSFESEYRPILPHELLGPEPLHTEASRKTGLIRVNPLSIVELLMDLKQWSSVFANIVSKAMILGVLFSKGMQGNYDGTLQVMAAEFHLPSPLVPVRKSYFARYCKQLYPGTWGVVDVSIENLFPTPSIRVKRRPSGCLITETRNGFSKVIWVEHVEVDNVGVPNIFQPLVASGFAFGATRWVNTIARHYERFEALTARSTPADSGVLIPQAGRTSLVKLSERMMRNFCADISASTTNIWTPLHILPGADQDVRIMTKFNVDDPGKPPGASVAFATSIWLPGSPKFLFNFLRRENTRNMWDILSYGRTVREFAYVVNGENPGNRTSIMQVISSPVLYLQESYTDSTGSYVVYAPLDAYAISMVLSGSNPDTVVILPSGFAILPDKATLEGQESSGSLLSVAFHIIDRASMDGYVPPESANIMFKIITETIVSIRAALTSNLPKN
ncbi:hypothetical protein I3760_12G124300 [Carya illinoinensis]|nr:hypothetical protein I3760_12G124300 [Carya illinoinensis]